MEKAGAEGKVLTLEADFGWSDVGSWAAVHRMTPKDADGNASRGRWLGLGAKNCLIHAPERLVVVLCGSRTPSSSTHRTLCWSGLSISSQEVRDLVDALNRQGLSSYTV